MMSSHGVPRLVNALIFASAVAPHTYGARTATEAAKMVNCFHLNCRPDLQKLPSGKNGNKGICMN